MVSERVKNLKPSVILDLVKKIERKKESGNEPVRFDVGAPGFDTPELITLEAIRALAACKPNRTGYEGLSRGTKPARDALSEFICTDTSGIEDCYRYSANNREL